MSQERENEIRLAMHFVNELLTSFNVTLAVKESKGKSYLVAIDAINGKEYAIQTNGKKP